MCYTNTYTQYPRVEERKEILQKKKKGIFFNGKQQEENRESRAGEFSDDLICTTPRLCQNNKTPVALRGRGTTSAYNCFPATGLYFKSKVFASVGRGSTETTRLQHGSSMFGDTHAKGGGGDLVTSMATWLSSSLRNESGKLKIFVVRTTLLAKSHRC